MLADAETRACMAIRRRVVRDAMAREESEKILADLAVKTDVRLALQDLPVVEDAVRADFRKRHGPTRGSVMADYALALLGGKVLTSGRSGALLRGAVFADFGSALHCYGGYGSVPRPLPAWAPDDRDPLDGVEDPDALRMPLGPVGAVKWGSPSATRTAQRIATGAIPPDAAPPCIGEAILRTLMRRAELDAAQVMNVHELMPALERTLGVTRAALMLRVHKLEAVADGLVVTLADGNRHGTSVPAHLKHEPPQEPYHAVAVPVDRKVLLTRDNRFVIMLQPERMVVYDCATGADGSFDLAVTNSIAGTTDQRFVAAVTKSHQLELIDVADWSRRTVPDARQVKPLEGSKLLVLRAKALVVMDAAAADPSAVLETLLTDLTPEGPAKIVVAPRFRYAVVTAAEGHVLVDRVGQRAVRIGSCKFPRAALSPRDTGDAYHVHEHRGSVVVKLVRPDEHIMETACVVPARRDRKVLLGDARFDDDGIWVTPDAELLDRVFYVHAERPREIATYDGLQIATIHETGVALLTTPKQTDLIVGFHDFEPTRILVAPRATRLRLPPDGELVYVHAHLSDGVLGIHACKRAADGTIRLAWFRVDHAAERAKMAGIYELAMRTTGKRARSDEERDAADGLCRLGMRPRHG